MRIGLVDIDGNDAKKKKWGATRYPNLALCKIARWHKEQGDEVEWAIPFSHYDIVYKSKVFNYSPDDLTCYDADEIVKGGTGYSITTKLPPPYRQNPARLLHLSEHSVRHRIRIPHARMS